MDGPFGNFIECDTLYEKNLKVITMEDFFIYTVNVDIFVLLNFRASIPIFTHIIFSRI